MNHRFLNKVLPVEMAGTYDMKKTNGDFTPSLSHDCILVIGQLAVGGLGSASGCGGRCFAFIGSFGRHNYRLRRRTFSFIGRRGGGIGRQKHHVQFVEEAGRFEPGGRAGGDTSFRSIHAGPREVTSFHNTWYVRVPFTSKLNPHRISKQGDRAVSDQQTH